MNEKLRLAIIPARFGSKRIPKKNIKNFVGYPIIKYSIDAAIKSNLFDKVIVSTDDETIANISRSFGAEVPFLRSENTSDDHSHLGDVIYETINRLDTETKNIEYICCILATAPFITSDFLKRCEKVFFDGAFHSLFPVSQYSYPIWRSLSKEKENNLFKMIWPENLKSRSQDLENTYHDAGMFYFLSTKQFMEHRTVFLEKNGGVELHPWFVQDIDNIEDWELAEIKFEMLAKKGKFLE